MSRVEKNEAVLKNIQSLSDDNQEGAFEQMVVVHMGLGIGILADISRSLAVIADALTEERNKDHE